MWKSSTIHAPPYGHQPPGHPARRLFLRLSGTGHDRDAIGVLVGLPVIRRPWRAVLRRRADEVAALYDGAAGTITV